MSEQVKEYAELKGQLDSLLKEWKTCYVGEPRQLSFPLSKRRTGPLDYEFYINAVPNQVDADQIASVHKDNELVSKNESVAAVILDKLGYSYKCGVRLTLGGDGRIKPDFIFYVPEIDKVIVIEIDGALDKGSYVTKSYHNTAYFVCNGMEEMKDFIVIRIGKGHEVNIDQIENLIYAAIDIAIDDIIV